MKADLDREIRLGILKKIYVYSPVQGGSCMIITLKKDGLQRRLIDYKRLNNAIPCQTNITQSPLYCASACPPGKKKTFMDAKDGNHSVVLAEGESREVKEFLCEIGRYRCVGFCQGLICSGDAYTHRFDNIMASFTYVV